MGRVKRTSETANAICAALERGRTLQSFDGDATLPSSTFVLDWVGEDEEFAGQYARARARGWDMLAEKALADAEACDDAQKGRLAFDARRWYLGKMLPKKYGDNRTLEHTGKVGLETLVSGLSED